MPWRFSWCFLGGEHHHYLICVCFWLLPGFTDQPGELRGFPVHTHLTKGSRGFGFNIVGGSRPREFLQVYSVTASGPSALKTGINTMKRGQLRRQKATWDVTGVGNDKRRMLRFSGFPGVFQKKWGEIKHFEPQNVLTSLQVLCLQSPGLWSATSQSAINPQDR